MTLVQHDRDFTIIINGQVLMHSRQHESELDLARLGCAHLTERKAASVLIGGLGMGYTLRQTLDMLGSKAKVLVSEMVDGVAAWNREFLGDLNGKPLEDRRVSLEIGDIVKLISRSKTEFDAILLDVDNGSSALTDKGNSRLYGREGILACRDALRERGCLAVWSSESSKNFEQLLMRCGFHVRRFRVPAYKGSKSKTRFIWVASLHPNMLPQGGGEPRVLFKSESTVNRRLQRKRR